LFPIALAGSVAVIVGLFVSVGLASIRDVSLEGTLPELVVTPPATGFIAPPVDSVAVVPADSLPGDSALAAIALAASEADAPGADSRPLSVPAATPGAGNSAARGVTATSTSSSSSSSSSSPAPAATPARAPAVSAGATPTTAPVGVAATTQGQVNESLSRLARAISARSIDQVAVAYPGLTAGERSAWVEFFANNPTIRASVSGIGAPPRSGGTAEIGFTMTIEYAGNGGRSETWVQRNSATFARHGDGWRIESIRAAP
jgi:hypothetical protein